MPLTAYLVLGALVFAIGVCTSRLAIRSIRKGHEYYHRTIYKKTLIEELPAIQTVGEGDREGSAR